MVFPFIAAAISVVSSIGAAIAGSVASIGAAVSSFASSVAPVIGNIVSKLPAIGEALGKIASTIMQIFGIFKPNETVEDMGERALQAKSKGITIEDSKDFDDYAEKLRNFELDPEESEKRSPAEKLVAGLAVATVGLEHKFNAAPGSLDGVWLGPLANPSYFTPERMETLIKTGHLAGDIMGYLNNHLSGADNLRMEKSLAEGQGLDDAGKAELYSALDETRDKWEQINLEANKNSKE